MTDETEGGEPYGYLLPFVKSWLGWFSVFAWVRRRKGILPSQREAHAKLVEKYIFCRIGVAVVWAGGLTYFATGPNTQSWLFLVGTLFPLLHIADVAQANFVRHIFEAEYDFSRGQPASASRVVVIALLNYVELICAFAALYLAFARLPGSEGLAGGHPLALYRECVYFSGVTQLTIGYGDLQPQGVSRAVAVVQALLGFALSLFIFGRLVSLLHDRSSAEARQRGCPPPAAEAARNREADRAAAATEAAGHGD